MSSTISARIVSGITAVETFSGADASNPDATFSALNEDFTLNATSTPTGTKEALFDVTLSSGSATIDLTQIPGKTADETINGTGLRIQAIKLVNKSTNANKIIASNGASNPYRLDGATTAWSDTLAVGQSSLRNLNGAGDVIGSSHKTIDLAGTGSQVLRVHLILGA